MDNSKCNFQSIYLIVKLACPSVHICSVETFPISAFKINNSDCLVKGKTNVLVFSSLENDLQVA